MEFWVFYIPLTLIAAVHAANEDPLIQGGYNMANCERKESDKESIICYANLLSTGMIDENAVFRKLKQVSTEKIRDRDGFYLGVTNDFAMEAGIYYDPAGKYWKLQPTSYRWGGPQHFITHAKTKGKIVFAYSWDALEEPEPIKHWGKYSAIHGYPGANWVYAHKGKVEGFSDSTPKVDCSTLHAYYDGVTTELKHVTYFLPWGRFCKTPADGYDIRVGKYTHTKTLIRGKKETAYVPKWECVITEQPTCHGPMSDGEKEAITRLMNLN